MVLKVNDIRFKLNNREGTVKYLYEAPISKLYWATEKKPLKFKISKHMLLMSEMVGREDSLYRTYGLPHYYFTNTHPVLRTDTRSDNRSPVTLS